MDTAEFDAFYNASNRRVLHQMYAMTSNLADAQECTQEAFARAWQRWKTVSQADSPEAWVRTVAWRIAASRWRKAKNAVTAMTRHGAPTGTIKARLSRGRTALAELLRDDVAPTKGGESRERQL